MTGRPPRWQTAGVKKRRERTARRLEQRDARKLVLDKERLFRLSRGSSRELPIEVQSSSVIEPRLRSMPCPQCEGTLAIVDHQADSAIDRRVDVKCVLCGVSRRVYFRIVALDN